MENCSIEELILWTDKVKENYQGTDYYPQVSHLLNSITSRAKHLIDLKLSYLSIGRSIPSLSGGELQRVRLANQLDCSLSGLIYILDEPCKGLHFVNVESVIDATRMLVEKGNTVISIEHNPQYVSAADYRFEMGPCGGPEGGYIISESHTPAEYTYKLSFKNVSKSTQWLSIQGVSFHNLKDISVRLPIGKVTCITGVSGSGKSSLSMVIEECCLHGCSDHCTVAENFEIIKRVQRVNQQPIGKTPRSTVVSYLGIYDNIRSLFASTQIAKHKGISASEFSMNVEGGRCECCLGTGKKKIELTYLPETYIMCPECKGKRFTERVLAARYKGYDINQILNKPVSELIPVFQDTPAITTVLKCLEKIGLGYLSLGQMSMNLSGGEAQRIKLAKCLSTTAKGKGVYILDEPTSGLNQTDIGKIEKVINELSQSGETIIIIDHNIQFIARISDYLIDLGKRAGSNGGTNAIEGSPATVMKDERSSWYNMTNVAE